MEFDFEGSYGTYHSNYDTRRYTDQFSDPGFAVGRTLTQVLGLAVMRFASAPVLPFRYSHYGRKISEFLDTAGSWSLDDDGRPIVAVDLNEARRLAKVFTERATALEQRIDSALGARPLSAASARALNDRLARLEQQLLDDSEPADKRWYRHVIYGWNIYSLYEGQPLPGLAEAIRLRDQAKVTQEISRVERALRRMLEGIERISIS
jgi:N-acetylated-alpha-linked acidic dipeptidase